MFRSILTILAGNVSSAIILLVRNLAIAKLISVHDYGIASTFLLALAIVEMMSALGLQQQIVQARDGNDPHLQAALQGFQLLRAVTNSVILFMLATPLADFLDIPEVAWAYRLIALVPLMNGFLHFDIYRLSRQLRYLPQMLFGTVPPLVSLLLVWPLYLYFHDYRILLWAILAQYALAVIVSHLVAERPYRLAFDRKIMTSSLRFGWPLLANGIMMFVIFNGERLIVGRELGMEALGLFAMGFSLTLTPALVMGNSASSFFLPQLSAAKEQAFNAISTVCFQVHLLFGALLVLGMALLGGPFITLVLGEKYASVIPLLVPLAIMQGLRVFKGGSSTVALARAQTENAFVANILRVALLPLGWYVAAQGGAVIWVIWLGALGEFLGFVTGLGLSRYRLRIPVMPLVAPFVIIMALFGVALVHSGTIAGFDAPPLWSGLALMVIFGLAVFSCRAARRYITNRRMVRHED